MLFAEGSAGGDKRDYDIRRGSVAGLQGTVLGAAGTHGRSKTDGYGLFADARVGFSLSTGLGELKPFVHARVSHQSIDGVEETGADIFSLSVQDVDLTRYEAGPGVQLALTPWTMGRAAMSGDVAIRYDVTSGDDDYAVAGDMLGTTLAGRVGELDDPVTVSTGLSADFGRIQGSLRGFWSQAGDNTAGGLSLGVRLSF